jgi:hypothetical protein
MTGIGGQESSEGGGVSEQDVAAEILKARGTTPPVDASEAASTEKPADGAQAESTLEQRIEEAAAALKSDESKADGEEPAPAKGRSSKLQKLIEDKYDGDEDAFVEGLFNQWNSTSRLSDTVEQLREELTRARAVPIEDHPDIQALAQQYAATEQRASAVSGRRGGYIREIGSIDQQIAKKTGVLERAEDFEKPDIRSEIRDLENKRERYIEKLEGLEGDEERLHERRQQLRARIAEAKTAIEAQQAREAEAKVADSQLRSRTVQDFEESFLQTARELEIPKAKQRRLYTAAKAELVAQIRALGPNAPEVSSAALRKATKAIVEGYATDFGLSAKEFQQLTKQKVQGTTRVAPKGTSVAETETAAPSTGRGEWSKEQAQAHARRVFRGY